MKTRLILLVALLFLSDATAQSPYFQQYFLLRKNDVVQIEAILKDKKGFMWFGTNKGLFRFDGINTKRYTNADSLAIDHVTALAQDSTGRLWVGHKNGQLSTIDNDVITKVSFREGDATEEISDILFARDGTMWFSTFNDGLYYHSNDRLYRLDEADGMPDIFVYDLEQAGDGSLWAATDRGVAVVTLDSARATVKVLDYNTGLPDNIIKKLSFDGSSMWFATEDAGVFKFDLSSGKATPLMAQPWTDGTIIDFLKIDNEFWIATGSDVVAYNLQDEQRNSYRPQKSTAPTTLYADEEGSVWVGARNGLFRSLGSDIRFIDDIHGASALTVDGSNNVWFANDDGVFKRIVNKDGSVYAEPVFKTGPFAKFKVISLFTDPKGFVWCGFYGQGALRINPTTNEKRHFEKELANGNVLSISGNNDHVWLSTLSGATMIDIKDEIRVTNLDRSRGLDCDYVYQVFEDTKGRTWFASDREGVAMKDEAGFHKMAGNLNAKAVYGFAEDSKGSIWANVQDDGLYKFDGSEFQPAILRNTNVNELASDPSGNIVAVHNLGIEVYNPNTQGIHHLDNEIGFGDRTSNLNAVAHDTHGNIFFGTDQGVVVYGQTVATNAKPQVSIDKFRIFDEYKDWSNGLKLSYDENNVTITFIGFWYQDPEGVNFKYKLENFDVDWISTGDRSAVFSSLDPGVYTFRVRASADSNFDNAQEDSVTFVIKPPFWRTIPFYVFVAVALGAAAYAYVQYRERNLLEEKLELEEKVAERTAEILKKNEEIQAQAEEIKAINESLEKRVEERTFELERKNKALEEYAFINAHNLRAPVASLLGLINLLPRAKTEEEYQEIITHMKTSAEKLDGVVATITASIEKSDEVDFFNSSDDGVD